MVVVATSQVMAVQQALHISFTTAMRVHTSVIGAVYTKALSLSHLSRRISTAGEMVNLMTVDAQRVMTLVETLNQLWSAPLQICVAVYFLYVTMGVAVMAGVGMLLLLIPLNLLIARLVRKIQVKQLKRSDERIKLMNEILSGIKVLKLYAWEESFIAKITAIRNKELHHLTKSIYLNAAVSFTFICAPFLVSLSTFTVYVLLGNELTAGKAFVAISLFNILRLPMALLPRVVVNFIQAQVSLHRLEEFLKLGELQPDNVVRNMPAHCSDAAVHIENGSFCWDRTEEVPILRNINVNIPSGSLVAVVGQVGCGKSTLLSALLGETEKLDGKGSTAFVPQEAWIQNATLRQNVLFGQSRDPERYQQVLTACALDPDIELLPAGDMTEIGEKGINLSGGQKQRVSLARSVYFDADIYLLDDPLSAVDSHVGKHIFNKVIGPQGLLKEKTRILVTHAVQYLPHVDQIIVLQDGVVSEVGTYTELKSSHGWFAELLDNYVTDNGLQDNGAENNQLLNTSGSINLEDDSSKVIYNRSNSCHHLDNRMRPRHHAAKSHSEANLPKLAFDKHSLKQSPIKIFATPERRYSVSTLGSVLSICEGLDADCLLDGEAECDNDPGDENDRKPTLHQRQSITSGFSLNSVLSLVEGDGHVRGTSTSGDNPAICTTAPEDGVDNESKGPIENEQSARNESVIERRGRTTTEERSQTGMVKFSVIMAYARSMGMLCALVILFSGIGAESSIIVSRIWLAKWSSTNVTSSQQRDTFLGLYGVMGLGQAILISVMNVTLAYSAMKATKNLHQGLLINIMHLPMRFFESSPLGRIMNRFSKDVNSVDDKVPRSLGMFLRTFLSSLGTVFVISYSTPLFLTCVLPLGTLYVFIQRFYISSSRQLRRIESVSRSPIYSHFFETITGTSTIRAFSQQRRFIMENHRRLDEAHVAHYPGICAFRWLALRLEFIGASILFFAALFSVIGRDTIAPGLVGLSVAYALQITGVLNWMVRQSSELETNIVAVERIKEYTTVTREADWIIPSHRPPEEWPNLGRIEIENFDLRYREQLPRVLKDLNCVIDVKEKIGIVGRTGAGKSTMTLALFRILERAGGRIVIDGIDIAKIGLQDLRSRLTIIPQDPVLFSGSLRMNLDPFDKHTDEELWNALDVTHLKTFVIGLEKGLQHPILESGENMSTGQRQLVCLARALLRKSKILVLDEATAAVDLETDDLIQQTIRREFADCTVLTIAHRLNTIMDCDRIMVLKDGSIEEFDSPSKLISKRGLFYVMAQDAGLA
ncbi:multidrug resistance-associated protein 1-like isoform X2 [Montipora capricornis]|uniref:multidrug resistance-associated protein 1-like isoform X2 n=1 Tax=Montipora capricornis TaxID=246305 RepID=UPI0035F2040E